MAEPSSETIGSYIFKTDSLCMMADTAGEKQPFEDIFRGDKKPGTEGKLEEDTMLAQNIVKDHQFTIMIGTMEIAMETIETDSREEGHLLKDVKKEEPYAKDLTLGKGILKKECFEEDGQYFEDIKSLEEYSRRTKYNGEDLLNKGSSDLLQQKDLEITRVKGRQYFNIVT